MKTNWKKVFELRFQLLLVNWNKQLAWKKLKNKSLVSKQFQSEAGNNRLGKEKFQWNAIIIVGFLLDVLYLTKWTRQSVVVETNVTTQSMVNINYSKEIQTHDERNKYLPKKAIVRIMETRPLSYKTFPSCRSCWKAVIILIKPERRKLKWFKQTRWKSQTTAGAREILTIQVLGSSGRRDLQTSVILSLSVKQATPGGAVKRRRRCKLLSFVLNQVSSWFIHQNLSETQQLSSVKNKTPRGARIFGPVAVNCVKGGFMKSLSLAPEYFDIKTN